MLQMLSQRLILGAPLLTSLIDEQRDEAFRFKDHDDFFFRVADLYRKAEQNKIIHLPPIRPGFPCLVNEAFTMPRYAQDFGSGPVFRAPNPKIFEYLEKQCLLLADLTAFMFLGPEHSGSISAKIAMLSSIHMLNPACANNPNATEKIKQMLEGLPATKTALFFFWHYFLHDYFKQDGLFFPVPVHANLELQNAAFKFFTNDPLNPEDITEFVLTRTIYTYLSHDFMPHRDSYVFVLKCLYIHLVAHLMLSGCDTSLFLTKDGVLSILPNFINHLWEFFKPFYFKHFNSCDDRLEMFTPDGPPLYVAGEYIVTEVPDAVDLLTGLRQTSKPSDSFEIIRPKEVTHFYHKAYHLFGRLSEKSVLLVSYNV